MSNNSSFPTKRRILFSLLEFNALIAIPRTSGLQADRYIQGRSNKVLQKITSTPSVTLERDSLTVSALACHAADPGSNPA